MTDSLDELTRKKRELEIALLEERELSEVRRRLLERYIGEVEELYRALRQKVEELKSKDLRIREAEEQLERANKLSLLGEIAGAIAHQIKNPLISIQGFAKRILENEDLQRIKSYANMIMRDAEKLSLTLTKLLEFSRMDEPKREPIDLNTVILDALDFLEHHLTRFKHIDLKLELRSDLPKVSADKIHIQQVLANLLVNAAQAMPHGGPITIETGQNENGVFFSVRDKGHGIPKEISDRIFEPFFTTKNKDEGTGLGLSICKRLVEANGGRIYFESEEGVGTTFYVYFPPHQNLISIPS